MKFFTTGVVNFNAKKGCQKCTAVGIYHNVYKRMSYPIEQYPLRSNESFRNRCDPQHHKITSIIENLNIDMIKSFPSSDPLHLLELGVMKRCLLRWIYGEKGFNRKWSKGKKNIFIQIEMS